jgi:hypothetical protein
MHTDKSLKKNHIVFSYNKENFKKICISMHFGFNNQFIKVTRTRSIFQKFQKKLFCFLLIFGVTALYVRHISDIKLFVDVRTVRFLPNKIRISLLNRTFLKP